jgi:23S rRNA pseudoU1915 N3-methylase RlmH
MAKIKLTHLLKESITEQGEGLEKAKEMTKGIFDPLALANDAKSVSSNEQESVGADPVTIALLTMAVPHFMQGIATLIEKVNRSMSKDIRIAVSSTSGADTYKDAEGDTKDDKIKNIKLHNKKVAQTHKGHKQYTSQLAKKIDHWAHSLHHAIVSPISGALWVMSFFPKFKALKDKTYRSKIAEIMYIAIMVTVCGVGAVSHWGHLTSGVDIGKLADLGLDAGLLASSSGEDAKGRFKKILNKLLEQVHV